MTIDLRLISIKDGGRFAMSWVAGTNPKALRSNLQRARIFIVDVPEVCEDMMEAMKSKEDKFSFRILFKLCFGTIHIFAEQVQHLYNVTMNFVCFNTFVLKQYSRKRLGSTITSNGNKRRRVESSDSLDITSLLLESEIFNDYSEEKFKLPNIMGVNGEKKQNNSTCTSIQINQITIRQISWDNPPLEGEEEAFGEATQDDRIMLLSGFSDVTMNFVCFNTFVLKQYSRKRLGSTITSNGNKRRRVESSDSLDITSLLLESEIFNDYSEEKFKLPNIMGVNGEKKQNNSTCTSIQINQITIRQISWDNPPLEGEEEAFGEATQDDRIMLLSGFSGTDTVEDSMSVRNFENRKRKSSFEITDCSPLKRSNGNLNESIDDIRYAPSVCNDTTSEFSVDLRCRPSTDVEKNFGNYNGNCITQEELLSTQADLCSQYPLVDEQISTSKTVDSNESTIHQTIPEEIINSAVQNLTVPSEIEHRKLPLLQRKRRRPHLIIDKVTKLSKTDMDTGIENIWQNCYNYKIKEHIAGIQKINGLEVFNSKTPSRRFQSAYLLVRFKNIFKSRMKQNHNIHRQTILQEILGDEFEAYKTDFKLKSKEICKPCETHEAKQRIEDLQNLPETNDIAFVPNMNNDCFQPNGYCERNEIEEEALFLKCSLDEIDPYAISFNFPTEAGKQRSEWGKEGILIKLLLAWVSENPNINMSTIIVGASRINAALTFHTLLDLAGLQYIEIIKDKTNSIESIKMGPEMIRIINEKFA